MLGLMHLAEPSGLGGATGDAIYGCVAGFGLTFIFKLLDQPTSMAPSYRWIISLLFGCQNSFGKTCKTSSFVQRKRPNWCLCLDVFPNDYKSDDNSLFCGNIHGLRLGEQWRKLHVRRSFGLGCFRWLVFLVGYPMQ